MSSKKVLHYITLFNSVFSSIYSNITVQGNELSFNHEQLESSGKIRYGSIGGLVKSKNPNGLTLGLFTSKGRSLREQGAFPIFPVGINYIYRNNQPKQPRVFSVLGQRDDSSYSLQSFNAKIFVGSDFLVSKNASLNISVGLHKDSLSMEFDSKNTIDDLIKIDRIKIFKINPSNIESTITDKDAFLENIFKSTATSYFSFLIDEASLSNNFIEWDLKLNKKFSSTANKLGVTIDIGLGIPINVVEHNIKGVSRFVTSSSSIVNSAKKEAKQIFKDEPYHVIIKYKDFVKTYIKIDASLNIQDITFSLFTEYNGIDLERVKIGGIRIEESSNKIATSSSNVSQYAMTAFDTIYPSVFSLNKLTIGLAIQFLN